MINIELNSVFHCLWTREDSINSLKNTTSLGDGKFQSTGKLFKFHHRNSFFVEDQEYHYQKWITLILCENTSVFWSCTDFFTLKELKKFENIGNHDSCWINSIHDAFWKLNCQSSDYIDEESKIIRPMKHHDFKLYLESIQNVSIVREREVEFKKKLIDYKVIK